MSKMVVNSNFLVKTIGTIYIRTHTHAHMCDASFSHGNYGYICVYLCTESNLKWANAPSGVG